MLYYNTFGADFSAALLFLVHVEYTGRARAMHIITAEWTISFVYMLVPHCAWNEIISENFASRVLFDVSNLSHYTSEAVCIAFCAAHY